jgi:hypothetical protein
MEGEEARFNQRKMLDALMGRLDVHAVANNSRDQLKCFDARSVYHHLVSNLRDYASRNWMLDLYCPTGTSK